MNFRWPVKHDAARGITLNIWNEWKRKLEELEAKLKKIETSIVKKKNTRVGSGKERR
jgi:hypothetical protein